MNSFVLNVDPRAGQYARLAASVLRTLKLAVAKRVKEGQSQREIADRLGWHPSQVSRVLNGRITNLTVQTVSDILWACDYEPVEFSADPLETLCSNAKLHTHDTYRSTSSKVSPQLGVPAVNASTPSRSFNQSFIVTVPSHGKRAELISA